MSKNISVSYEDLVFGAFTVLLFSSDDTSLSYEQLKDYENAIVEYCTNNKIGLLMNTNEPEQAKFRQEHDEFTFEEQRILLANLGKWMRMKNAALDLDDGCLFLNSTVSKALLKEKTLSLR